MFKKDEKKAMKAKPKKAMKAKPKKANDETEKRTFTRRELAALITEAMFFHLWQTPEQAAASDCTYEGNLIADVIFDELS